MAVLKRHSECLKLRANRRFLRQAQDRFFDYVSRDETASDSAQDDNSYIDQFFVAFNTYHDGPRCDF